MQAPSRRRLLSMAGIAGAMPLVSGLAKDKVVPGQSLSVEQTQVMARKRIQELHLPNVPLLTHEGKQVLFYDDLMKDKVVTINFFYTKCDEICPIVMPNLAKVQKLLAEAAAGLGMATLELVLCRLVAARPAIAIARPQRLAASGPNTLDHD